MLGLRSGRKYAALTTKMLRGNQILVGDNRDSRDTRQEYLVPVEEQYSRRLFLSKCEKVQICIRKPREPVGSTKNV